MLGALEDYLALTHDQRLERLVGVQQQKAALAAEEQVLLHAIVVGAPDVGVEPASVRAAYDGYAYDKDWVDEEIACLLRLSPRTVGGRTFTAERLVTVFPDTLTALSEGRISFPHALRLSEATTVVEDEVAQQVEAAVLPKAGRQTPGQFAASIRKALSRYDTREQEQQHSDALAGRRVEFIPQPDGMCDLWAHLPAHAAAAIRDQLQHCADLAASGDGGDGRTADQRRADALVDLILHPMEPLPGRVCDTCRIAESTCPIGTADSTCPNGTADSTCTSGTADSVSPRGAARVGARTNVQVTVALSTLLGLDQHGGELTGHGAIPAALARAIAADANASWRRIITDDHGQFLAEDATAVLNQLRQHLDTGANTYRPNAALDRHIRLRDQTCRFPGCRTNANRCELDHITAWADGGLTTLDNLHALCVRHHHLKHETRWHVKRCPDGGTEWTAPNGKHYTQPQPDPLPLDTTTIELVDEPAPF